jgi:hypothetical protein
MDCGWPHSRVGVQVWDGCPGCLDRILAHLPNLPQAGTVPRADALDRTWARLQLWEVGVQELAWSTPMLPIPAGERSSSRPCCVCFLWREGEAGAGWSAGAPLLGGGLCFPGPTHSSHSCPFVLQVFRRADKNGECGFHWVPRSGVGWGTSERESWELGGMESIVETNLGGSETGNEPRHSSQRKCCRMEREECGSARGWKGILHAVLSSTVIGTSCT